MSSFTETQQRVLAILPKVTGVSSVVSSVIIVALIYQNSTKRQRVYHRLLLGMSVADMSSSMWLALSTWPIPQDSGIIWAVGNATTCQFQGFFTQFGISSPLYNVSLSVYYLLTIRYHWKEQDLQAIERYLHALPLVWALGTAVAGFFLDLFHSANLWCWIAPNEQGDNDYNLYRWIFFYGPLWASTLVLTIQLILIFLHVRTVTLRSEKYIQKSYTTPQVVTSASGSNNNNDLDFSTTSFENNNDVFKDQGYMMESSEEHQADGENVLEQALQPPKSQTLQRVEQSSTTASSSVATATKRMSNLFQTSKQRRQEQYSQFSQRRRQVAYQCLRYALAFYITWIPITLVRIFQTIQPPKSIYALLVLAAMLTPMQGLTNFFVYLYPTHIAKKPKSTHQHKGKHKPNTARGHPAAPTVAVAAAVPVVLNKTTSSSQDEASPPSPAIKKSALKNSSEESYRQDVVRATPPSTPIQKSALKNSSEEVFRQDLIAINSVPNLSPPASPNKKKSALKNSNSEIYRQDLIPSSVRSPSPPPTPTKKKGALKNSNSEIYRQDLIPSTVRNPSPPPTPTKKKSALKNSNSEIYRQDLIPSTVRNPSPPPTPTKKKSALKNSGGEIYRQDLITKTTPPPSPTKMKSALKNSNTTIYRQDLISTASVPGLSPTVKKSALKNSNSEIYRQDLITTSSSSPPPPLPPISSSTNQTKVKKSLLYKIQKAASKNSSGEAYRQDLIAAMPPPPKKKSALKNSTEQTYRQDLISTAGAPVPQPAVKKSSLKNSSAEIYRQDLITTTQPPVKKSSLKHNNTTIYRQDVMSSPNSSSSSPPRNERPPTSPVKTKIMTTGNIPLTQNNKPTLSTAHDRVDLAVAKWRIGQDRWLPTHSFVAVDEARVGK